MSVCEGCGQTISYFEFHDPYDCIDYLLKRAEKSESERDALRARVVELEARLDIGTGNMYDVVVQENERLRARAEKAEDALKDADEDAERLAKILYECHDSWPVGDVAKYAALDAHRARVGAKLEGESVMDSPDKEEELK